MRRLHSSALLVVSLAALSWASNLVPRQSSNPRPAFTVGLTHNVTFSQPTTVKYDRVILDSTSSYDPSTGVYTVPVTGDYVVMVHAVAEYDGTLWVELHRNDDYIFSAYAHTTAQYASASNVGVFRYNKGDRLHVVGRGTSILYGYPDEVYTTLSAFLLYARGGN